MDRRRARDAVLASTYTVGELRALLAAARKRGGMSRVAPEATLGTVLDVLERWLAGRDASEVPAAMALDEDGVSWPTRDRLMLEYIFTECVP